MAGSLFVWYRASWVFELYCVSLILMISFGFFCCVKLIRSYWLELKFTMF